MTIASLADYQAAAKYQVELNRPNASTFPYGSTFAISGGYPGAGTLAAGNTTTGIVPVSGTSGYATLPSFGSGVGYLTKVALCSTRNEVILFDRLFVAGAFAVASTNSLSSQPSFTGRIPTGDETNTELWVEHVTTTTGTPSIAVTYTNSAGVAGRTTGTISLGAAASATRCWRLPLQSGDCGVQKVESVVTSVATVGTTNVMVLRRLWSGRTTMSAQVPDVPRGLMQPPVGLLGTNLVQLYDTSALYVLAQGNAGFGAPDAKSLDLEIAIK